MSLHRDRFIAATALAYAILASLWIFLSDQFLSAITDVDQVVWLSTAKGLVFITWSTALFYFALQNVPDGTSAGISRMADTAGPATSLIHRLLTYVFAAIASLAMIWVHMKIREYQHEPLLLLSMSPIILSALLGGLGPGLAATVISTVGNAYYGVDPIGSFMIASTSDQFRCGLLAINGILVSALSEKLHREQRALAEHREQLNNSQEQLKVLSDNLPDGMVFQSRIEPDGSSRFLYVSAGIEQLTGVSVHDALLDRENLISRVIPDDIRTLRAAQEVAHRTLTKLNLVVRIHKPGGELRFMRISSSPRRLDNGSVIWDGIAVDVTEHEHTQAELRKLNAELERRVAERTAALTQANKSLESFSHIVAHDLRAPLRQLEGFASVLQQEHADQLNDDGRQLLQNISDSRTAMSDLIDGMLAVSRLEHARLELADTDLSALATEVANQLVAAEPQRRVTFVIQPGLTARADRTLMQNVFDNLLGNAWKFTSRHALARIEFGALDSGEKRTYFVRDDGAGFDPKDADNLFELFHRLHSQSQFSGTGIGLASVKSIIINHGGAIWAEGAIEHGATVYFTLPKPAQSM